MIDETILALAMCFGTLAVSLAVYKVHGQSGLHGLYSFYAGLTWVFASVAVFSIYGPGWTILTVGFGILVLLDGAFEVTEVNKV